MNKMEFLEILREALNGEVTPEVIEQNIKYYDQYINANTSEEELRIIDMLGDPRLIAKTIIESEKAAKQKKYSYQGSSDENYSRRYNETDDEEYQQRSENQGSNRFGTNLTVKQKFILIFFLIVFILIVLVLGRIIIGFLFAFGVPILLVLLLYNLFKKRN